MSNNNSLPQWRGVKKKRTISAALATLLGFAFLIPAAHTAVAAPEPTEVGSWDFEDGTTSPWELRNDTGEAQLAITDNGAGGSGHAVTISHRGRHGDGLVIDVSGSAGFTATPGQTVYFEADARFDDGNAGYLNLSSQHGYYDFSNVIYSMPVGTDWTHIAGYFTMPYYSDGHPATLFIETPWVPEGTGNIDSFSVDNIRLSLGEAGGLPQGYEFGAWDFDNEDIAPWTLRDQEGAGAVLTFISPGAEDSAHAITISNRDTFGDGIVIDVNGEAGFTIPAGQLVLFEAYARFEDGGGAVLNLSAQHGDNFNNVIYQMPVGTEWTRISGSFIMPQYEEGEPATLYVETPWVPAGTGNTDSFSIDQIRLSVPLPEPEPAESAVAFGGELPLTQDAFDNYAWDVLPGNQLLNNAGWFQTRYTRDFLTVIAEINAPADAIRINYDGDNVTVTSDGTVTGDAQAIVQPQDGGGFRAIIHLPHDAPPIGSSTLFNFDAVNTAILPAGTSLENSFANDFEAPTGFIVGGWNEYGEVGSITFAQPFAFTQALETDTPPVIDGEVDEVWADAQTFNVNTLQSGLSFSTAVGRTLWNGNNLYLLVEVTDDNIHTEAENWWYRDSVTIYLDLGNAKTGAYRNDYDVQISVNADGEVNFGGNGIGYNFADRVQAAATRTDIGYTVEVAITLTANGQNFGGVGTFHGFDVQVYDNDAPGADSPRTGIQVWTDVSGDAWQNTSRWGVVELVAAAAPAPEVVDTPAAVATPMPVAPSGGNPAWILPLILGLLALGALSWFIYRNSQRNKARLAAQGYPTNNN